jgi:hypothetical protein
MPLHANPASFTQTGSEVARRGLEIELVRCVDSVARMALGATCQGMQPQKQSALDVPFLAQSSTAGVVPVCKQ